MNWVIVDRDSVIRDFLPHFLQPFGGYLLSYLLADMSPSKYESSKEINTMITILKVFALNNSRTEISYCRANYLHSTENHFLGVGKRGKQKGESARSSVSFFVAIISCSNINIICKNKIKNGE